MRVWFRFFTLLLVAGLFVGMFFLPRAAMSQLPAASAEVKETLQSTPAPRITRFVVLGIDRAAGLADSIFLVTLQESEPSLRVLQIPRDTYANYTDRDYRKLNGAPHALGEPDFKRTLSEALGVKIHYFVALDLSVLKNVVDAIGGIDLEVPQDMYYSDPAQGLEISLSKGAQHLDGAAAEEFIRYRSGYVNADLGRLDAQKLFLAAFAKKCSGLSLASALRVTCTALNKLQTDIPLPDLIRVVSVLKRVNTENIPMATLAGQAVQGSSGAWYYMLNRAGACHMVNEYLLPSTPLSTLEFDKQGFFDRPDHKEFHEIYLAPEESSAR